MQHCLHDSMWICVITRQDERQKNYLHPKSLQMVIAAMKLKDAYSLEEKLWPS